MRKKRPSDEHLICLSSGEIVRARDVKPVPDNECFDLEMFNRITGTPNNPQAVEQEEGELGDIPRAPLERPPEPVSIPAARPTMLRREYVERGCGYTDGCLKCRALQRGMDGPE